jgi:serine/threonine-protein kinase
MSSSTDTFDTLSDLTRLERSVTIHAQEAKPAADRFQVGQVLCGTYEVRELLGSGGMGQVYEAKDRRLNRVVALKVSWPHIAVEALRREAQVLAAFRHAGLVTAHALCDHEGVEFLVMERLNGKSLEQHLEKGLLPFEEVSALLLRVCETLALLHENGLAHADLKPANIMLAPGDRVVLLDFGIARVEQIRIDGRPISGSPHYMAPETIRAQVKPGSAHLVDLYALGVLAYVLLVGNPPFDHTNPMEILRLHLGTRPPRVSATRKDVWPHLDTLVAALLEKEPDARPESIDEVRAALSRPRSRTPKPE